MPIVRGKHAFEEQFTQLPNRWLRDDRLTLKAIGLLSQLHSHSAGWSVSIATLARANKCGQEQIRSAIAELEKYGYLIRKQNRVQNKFAESVYETADPSLGFPSSGFPITEKPTPKNKSNKNNNEKNVYADFEEFWQSYPRKVGRLSAQRAWDKIVAKSGYLAIAGARRLAHDPNLPPMQYVPYPATWLNRAGWLDASYPEREKSKEDLLAEARAKFDHEKSASRKYLEEQQKIAEAALNVQIPTCEHNKVLAACKICIKKMAQDG